MPLNARRTVLACLPLISAVYANELYRTSHFPAQDSVPIANFSYVGLTGPLNWYALNTSYALCDKGKNQSPIDLDSTVNPSVKRIPGSKIQVHIPDVMEAEFENIGSFVEVVTNGTLITSENKYKLVEFHYHSPSEHRVNGEYFPMEQHLVFEAKDGTLAVVTFLIELSRKGFDGPLLREVLSHVLNIATPGETTMTGALSFGPLLAHLHRNDIYHYSGSLTSPPCNEPVAWYISTEPLEINVGTYLDTKKVLRFNSRYTQDTLGKINLLENAAKELKG